MTEYEFAPRVGAPVVPVDAPPNDLGLTTPELKEHIENERLPAYRVPPPTSSNEDEPHRFWVLSHDVEAIVEDEALEPAPEPDDDLRRVYVIELEGCELTRHSDGPCVYVGQSVRSPRKRFIQHLVGYKAGRKHVTKWGVRLRPDLYGSIRPTLHEEEAKRRERDCAVRLAQEGFNIHGLDVQSA